ncbi:MAG: DUF4349 domain-containing protein [Flavobacteriales bacterium]|jgi:hypothetical protein|nr:DUF4349 domain-containing protein [Flavobacteriales bacterium]
MKTTIQTIGLFIILGFTSCGSQYDQYEAKSYAPQAEMEEAVYEEIAKMDDAAMGNSQAAEQEIFAENHQDGVRSLAASIENDGNLRFIRKAQIRFKTCKVRNTTHYLEHAVVNLGGIVTNTKLYSDIESVKKIAVSKDSSLRITRYRVNNDMTIRIPNTQLDSLLKVIAPKVKFLDERIVTANEISLRELKNNLEQQRLTEYHEKLSKAIKNQKDKMNKVVDAHDRMLQKQRQKDAALIRNMELDFEVEYSTVQLTFYQEASLDKELVENELNIKDFEPSFFTQLWESLVNGFNGLLFIIVQLANVWFVILALVVAWVVYKRRKGKA